MKIRRTVSVAAVVLAVLPAIAGGRPACCVKKPVPASHACCAAAARAAAPKGCCKAPEAPRPDARAQAADAPALLAAAPAGPIASTVVTTATEAAIVRVARLEHRAASPTDSPPDLLSRHQSFLI